MPCVLVKMSGGGTAICKVQRAAAKRCAVCGKHQATYQCDFPMPTKHNPARTCDAYLCAECLVIVDYLQLMSSPAGSRKFQNRNEEVSQISRSLKLLAKELDVPLVALSQLSRAPETRASGHEPQLSDLRDSGSIEQDADVVAFVYRPEVYEKDEARKIELDGEAELIIAKQRNGPTGTVHLAFIKKCTRFESRAPEYT